MAKILNLRGSKNTLFQVDGKAMETAEVEDVAEVKLMIIQEVGKDQNVI